FEMRLVLADAPAGDRGLHHGAEQMERGVQPHQPMAALPVELRLKRAPHDGRGTGLEHVKHTVARRAFARVEHAPWAQAPAVARLAAAQRLEHRAVQLHCLAVDRDDGGFTGFEVRLLAKEKLGHQSTSVYSAATTITSAPP